MRRALLLSPLLLLALSGCVAMTPEPADTPRGDGHDPGFAVLLDDGCAPHDPEIPRLAARLTGRSGRDSYYAARVLDEAALDRDALVLRLLARHAALRACMPEGRARAERLLGSMFLVEGLLRGGSPSDPEDVLAVNDLRVRPRTLPFARRVCSGTGLEGAAECFGFGLYAALLDVLSFPLGTWIWAAEDDRARLELSEHPPSEAVLREVAAESARLAAEWARVDLAGDPPR